ncbi:nagb/rpia/CoA transferase-like protein, partial [Pyrenochaeta sp. DS3sAY3a]
LPKPPKNIVLAQDEMVDYDIALEAGIIALQNDLTSPARSLASTALRDLAHIAAVAEALSPTWGELWTAVVHAAEQLCLAKPSMNAPVKAVLVRALERVASRWNAEQEKGGKLTRELARIAAKTFAETLRERLDLTKLVDEQLVDWLHYHCTQVMRHSLNLDDVVRAQAPQLVLKKMSVRILTLGNADSVRSAVLHTLEALPDLAVHLTVLESRPRLEGADMAAQIYAAVCDKNRIAIQIIPDCAVGSVVHDVDVVLLAADRITATGDVSSKIGSLATAICAKQLNEAVKVVVLSDVDLVAPPGQDLDFVEYHPSSEMSSAWAATTRNQLEGKHNVDILGEWYEWIPSKFIDVYITEMGAWGTKEVGWAAKEVADLEEHIFAMLKKK